MVLTEKYDKTILNNKLYDTVMLVDVTSINDEKYFIVSGYLFNEKNANNIQDNCIDEKEIKDTFYKRENNTDIDAYYLIYNLDKKEKIKNKKEFIRENNLEKNLKLDRTKCEKINIGNDIAYKINTKECEYLFMQMSQENIPYVLMKKNEDGFITDKMITFNEQKNKVEIMDEYKYIEEKIKEIEKVNLIKLANDANSFVKKANNINKETKEDI